jgi:murein L,D-transpeptidase YcbB/YkuD
MTLRQKIIQIGTLTALMLAISTSSISNLHASELVYQEAAADVIMNSLQGQKKHSFLRKLYTQLFFVPLWMHEQGLSKAGKELFSHIKNDGTLDKTGKLYQDALLLEALTEETYNTNATTAQKINLEFKISQLYEAYTNYAYLGGINWGAFNARISNLMVNDVSTEWVLHRPYVDALAMAEQAALGGSLGSALTKATPTKYRYKALQKELVKYREIKANGGWLPIPLKETLKVGMSRQSVYDLRERLRITGDYTPCSEDNSTEGLVYDKCLKKAVKHFQKRNGLSKDGAVGPGTLKVLNKTVDERITTMLLNLDRIKWLKQRNAKRHVIINIPDFMLYFEEDGKLRQSIRTVVGKPKNPTPIFSNTVKTIVLNPYWNLPTSIVQKEMIPKLLKNSNAMKKKGIEIRKGWGKNAELVNPSSIDWAQYRYSKGVPFRFAQVPGPRNALGKVKFLFPNKYAVYMHDTPSKGLFNRSKRAFSHGCIRLQKPRELLKTFASFNSNIDFAKSQKILKGKNNS